MRTEKQLERLSVALCMILRHIPEDFGIQLSIEGYVAIDALVEGYNTNRASVQNGSATPLTHDEVLYIVDTDKKGRYTIKGDLIRCNQGHSTKQVDLSFVAQEPPRVLYHGTPAANFDSITLSGLRPGRRHYVHLSEDVQTATNVGNRRTGAAIIFEVMAMTAHEAGHEFFKSDNGVWLVRDCPTKYLNLL